MDFSGIYFLNRSVLQPGITKLHWIISLHFILLDCYVKSAVLLTYTEYMLNLSFLLLSFIVMKVVMVCAYKFSEYCWKCGNL